MAALLRHLGVGAAHVVGTSTGGAIAQRMALEHADTARSLTLSSSFARPDAFLRREFALRRKLLAEAEPRAIYDGYATFLFSPRFAREHADRVADWVDRAATGPFERDVAIKRTDMIMAHDTLDLLGQIDRPTCT
jgi:pimeloyl-ACP methyl ester carboxylesterase